MPCLYKLVTLVVVLLICSKTYAEDEVNFSRDILPLLSDRCFHCHGPEPTHREADLRLDQREAATADREGTAAIIPGNRMRVNCWHGLRPAMRIC